VYFAKHVKSLPGTPDVVFRRKRLVVFVDSEFWHVHPRKCVLPQTNRAYWKRKLLLNKVRDRAVTQALRLQGYRVMRVWQRDVMRRTDKVVDRIVSVLKESK
jgi:DNA mismatch endonuclease (patch repair protein)